MAPSLTSPDTLATAALALCVAAGKADFEIEAKVERRRNGELRFWLILWDPCAKRNPLDCHYCMDFGDTLEGVLAATAMKLGVAYPLPATTYATAAQQEALINLYNSAFAKRWEKTKMLLNLPTTTEAQAEKMLGDGPLSFRQELRRREAAARGFAVAGSVELVQPQPLAA